MCSRSLQFGYEYFNPALAASGGRWKRDGPLRIVAGRDRLEQPETKRRAPNVVARLMGLDALPDELPTVRPRKSLQEMPTYGCAKPEGGNPVLIRQHSHGGVPSSWQRPPLPRSSVQRLEEGRASAPGLPFRDHPQEEQLQKFKKEFEAKQEERLRASQLEEMNRQLEEKKNKVRVTLDKARIALSQGIVADPKRHNGQGKFEESKEFLDAMEFLQCNKDFIFQFLQQKPHVVFSNENSNATTPVAHVKPLKKGKGGAASPRDSTDRRREGFSPGAIARLFMSSDSRKRSNDHNKQQPAAMSSGSQPAIERCNSAGSRRVNTESRDMSEDVKLLRSSTSTTSRYMLPAASPKANVSKDGARGNKYGARDVIGEIKERLRRRDQNSKPGEEVRHSKDSVIRNEHLQGSLRDSKEIAREIAKTARESGSRKSSNFTLTKSLSTGKRVSMMRPDMDMSCTSDGEDTSTPSVKVVRENVSRSCISLPSSPHLSARSHEAAAASPKVTRKRVPTEHTKPLPTDSPAAHRAMATKKSPLLASSESPRRASSPRSSTEGEKRMRRSASVNECATRSNHTSKHQKIDSPVSTAKRQLDPANVSPASSNLTRSRSMPNAALLRQCTATQTARSGTAKNTHEAAKQPASDKKKLSFFSVGRKKPSKDGPVPPEASIPSSNQNAAILFPNPSPVLSRVAALAEACVSHTNTLSDADSAADVRIHVRSSRNGSKKGTKNPRHVVVACAAEVDIARRVPSSPDESVVPESSADTDAAPCEEEFLEVLSQLPAPSAKRKPSTDSPRPPPLPSTANPPSLGTQPAQSSCKQIAKPPPRAWKTARDILDTVHDCPPEPLNIDKNSRPCPVSVLEPPFHEEESSPSPLEFKEITNDLQELQIRLRLLKSDGNDLRASLDEVENVPESQRSKIARQSLSSGTKSHQLHKPAKSHLSLDESNDNRLPPPPPPHSSEADDFAFVRDILVTSGFHTHGGRNLTRWHSSTQPISYQIFKNVDSRYSSSLLASSPPRRKILFDAVNEVLVAQLDQRQCYEQLLTTRSTPTNSLLVATTGKSTRLVEDVWRAILLKRQFPAHVIVNELHVNEHLESLVAQDLQSTASPWMSLHRDVDRICLQMEKLIWSDLVDELVSTALM